MTIPSTPRKAGPFLGNGVTTSFPFSFKVFAAADVKVVVANSAGVETTLVLNSDYSVALNPNQDTSPGGVVTYPLSGSPLPSGSVLSIIGNVSYDQPLDLPSGGNFSPLALENQLDRVAMQIQQLAEEAGRALRAPVTADVDLTLPTPQASTFLGWTSDASGLRNYTRTEIATIAAFGDAVVDKFTGDGSTTAFTLSKDPGSQDNLLVSVGGVVQENGVDFTWSPSAPTTLTFASAPPNGEKIQVYYQQALPTEDSVLRADLADTTNPANGAALVANAVGRVESVAALRALPAPSRKTVVYLEGYYTPGDGGGGALVWMPTSNKADNGGTVFMPDSAPANGRWERSGDEIPVTWFGAQAGVSTDQYTAFIAAIAAASGKDLVVPDGNYRIDTPITITSALHIKMSPEAVLDFSSMPAGTSLGQRKAITFAGSVGSDVAITTNVAVRATVLQVSSTAGLQANQWIMVRSDDPYAPGGDPAQGTLGHITKIRTVDSGTQITLWEPSPFAYTAASNARITPITLLAGAKISGGAVLCGGVGSVHSGVRFEYCLAPLAYNVSCSDAEDIGLSFANCVNPLASKNIITGSTSPGGAIGNTGYGIAVYGGKGGEALGNSIERCRHAVAGAAFNGVVSLGFTFSHNSVFACGYASANTWALDCHEPCYNWKFLGNTVIGCHGGAVLRGPGTVFVGNIIRDCVVSGVVVQQFLNNSVGLPRTVVKGNTVENTGSYGIYAQGYTVSTDKILRLVVQGNIVSGTANHAIFLDRVVGGELAGNDIGAIGGTTRVGVLIRNSDRVRVVGGQIDCGLSTNGNGITIEDSSRVSVVGVQLYGSSGATNQDGIRAQGSGTNTSIIINGNYIGGFARYAVHTTNTDRVIVTNNDVRDVVGGTKIFLSGATTTVNANNIT